MATLGDINDYFDASALNPAGLGYLYTESKIDSGLGDDYYSFAVMLRALLDMHVAIGGAIYLTTAIAYANRITATATIENDDGRLCWNDGHGAPCGLNADFQIGTQLARLAYVAKQAGGHDAFAYTLGQFVADEICGKWCNPTYNTLYNWNGFAADFADASGSFGDKPIMLLEMLTWLVAMDASIYDTNSGSNVGQFKTWLDTQVPLFHGRFYTFPDDTSCLLWDYTTTITPNPWSVNQSTQCFEHGARVPLAVEALHDTGNTAFTASERRRLGNVLGRRVWNGQRHTDASGPLYKNFCDGSQRHAAAGYQDDPWLTDNKNSRGLPWGWARMGRYSLPAHNAAMAAYDALIAYDATDWAGNISTAQMLSEWSRLGLAAACARNLSLSERPTAAVTHNATSTRRKNAE